jgi:hypothetical protein
VTGNPNGHASRAPDEGNTSTITSGLDDYKPFAIMSENARAAVLRYLIGRA